VEELSVIKCFCEELVPEVLDLLWATAELDVGDEVRDESAGGLSVGAVGHEDEFALFEGRADVRRDRPRRVVDERVRSRRLRIDSRAPDSSGDPVQCDHGELRLPAAPALPARETTTLGIIVVASQRGCEVCFFGSTTVTSRTEVTQYSNPLCAKFTSVGTTANTRSGV